MIARGLTSFKTCMTLATLGVPTPVLMHVTCTPASLPDSIRSCFSGFLIRSWMFFQTVWDAGSIMIVSILLAMVEKNIWERRSFFARNFKTVLIAAPFTFLVRSLNITSALLIVKVGNPASSLVRDHAWPYGILGVTFT